jgi:hypothetical protein
VYAACVKDVEVVQHLFEVLESSAKLGDRQSQSDDNHCHQHDHEHDANTSILRDGLGLQQ